jgi:hypothetical protein
MPKDKPRTILRHTRDLGGAAGHGMIVFAKVMRLAALNGTTRTLLAASCPRLRLRKRAQFQ